jgi:ClpP class serine protease
MELIGMPDTNTTSQASPQDGVTFLDSACKAITDLRQRPLLVLFYPPPARISEDDLSDVYRAFRAQGVTQEGRLESLDVLIESYGGDPVAGYRLAQLLRDFAKEVDFLVPAHAYSAATILCFAANNIRLGHYAGLSPIDISLVSEAGEQPGIEVELASVDSFVEFAVSAREKIERLLTRLGSQNETRIDADLLVSMVEEIGALEVGKYFRERTLTGAYAEELLDT